MREEQDSLGKVLVPDDKLWGAQTQRSLEHFSIGNDLIPHEMVESYALLKKAAAEANFREGHLSEENKNLICQVCDEIIAGKHDDMFPLHVWMTGSGTQFNMNMNEVISNRCCQIMNTPLGSKTPVHPNDHVNMSQSSNDTFPTAMHIATVKNAQEKLLPMLEYLKNAISKKSEEWMEVVKIGRTHMQDATPLTVGQEWSGFAFILEQHIERINFALKDVLLLTIGGTAVGTGINTTKTFGKNFCEIISEMTNLSFKEVQNKFAYQGSHDALNGLSLSIKNLAASLFKIANDIRLLSCGPRAGFHELLIPENEPGSSIMPGKVNPTQAEALTMIAIQVMSNSDAISMSNASGYLQMNVYKPLIINNMAQNIRILSDGMNNFTKFLVEGTSLNLPKIKNYVDSSLMLVTALSPEIGYDKASKIAHYADENNTTLKEAALKLNIVTEAEFDRIVVPKNMTGLK